jgi:hypothetical protein
LPTWAESRKRRLQAVSLRRQGLSYKQIRALIGGSMATMSKWLRDVPLTDWQRRQLFERRASNGRATGQANRERRLRKEAEIRRACADQVGSVRERDLFIAGVIAYAAEGSKRKPWQSSCQVKFINSDPRMIRLFLSWLDLAGVDPPSITFRVAIHKDAEVAEALDYWAGVVGVPAERFLRTTLKRGNPRTTRRNVGRDYRGCLIVHVRRSGDLNKRLEACFQSILDGLDSVGSRENEQAVSDISAPNRPEILKETFRGGVTGQHVSLWS